MKQVSRKHTGTSSLGYGRLKEHETRSSYLADGQSSDVLKPRAPNRKFQSFLLRCRAVVGKKPSIIHKCSWTHEALVSPWWTCLTARRTRCPLLFLWGQKADLAEPLPARLKTLRASSSTLVPSAGNHPLGARQKPGQPSNLLPEQLEVML